MELLCVSWDLEVRNVKKFFTLWQAGGEMKGKRKWMTRKAHLKINKVSVDFLISSLTAQHFSLPFSTLCWRLRFFLDESKKKDFNIREKKLFARPEKGKAGKKRFTFVSSLSAENVSSNIKKSNYLYGSWTRRQIKLNCLLCETLKKCRIVG